MTSLNPEGGCGILVSPNSQMKIAANRANRLQRSVEYFTEDVSYPELLQSYPY